MGSGATPVLDQSGVKAIVKVASGPGGMRLCDVQEPTPGPDEVLLRIEAAGICGTDLHILSGEYPCRPPVILGHEFAGTIVELGCSVSGWGVGDRVTSMPFAKVCGTCRHCQTGELGLCPDRLSYGSGVNGAFAEYLAVEASGLYRLPESLDFVAASQAEPLACVAKAVFDVGELRHGESVAVFGPGPIGLLTTQVALVLGARVALVGLQTDADRLALGQRLGAGIVVSADTPELDARIKEVLRGDGVDVVFECSGSGDALNKALHLARKKGRIVQVGLLGHATSIDVDAVVLGDLTIRGSFASSRGSWERALDLIRGGQVDTHSIVSDVLPMDEWEEAFRRASSRKGLRVVIRP